MNEQKIIRAIEHFETTAAKVVYIRLNPDKSNYNVRLRGETRIFEEILKLESAEHFKFLVPCPEEIVLKESIYVRYQQHKDAVGILWDMTEKEINTHIWGWLFVLDKSMEEEGTVKGTWIAKCLRKFMRDIKAELEMGGQDG